MDGEVDDNNDADCLLIFGICAFGVIRGRSGIPRPLVPNESRSGSDLEYFSSGIEILLDGDGGLHLK